MVFRGLQYVANTNSQFVLVNTEKHPTINNQYDLIIHWYNFDYGTDMSIQTYASGNRACPVGARTSSPTNTFRDNTCRYKLSCLICGINTYYAEIRTPAPVIRKTQTMYVSSISASEEDEYTGIRTPQRKYFVATDALPSQTFRERF